MVNFLALPAVAQRNVIRNSSFRDLVILTLGSKISRKLVKEANLRPDITTLELSRGATLCIAINGERLTFRFGSYVQFEDNRYYRPAANNPVGLATVLQSYEQFRNRLVTRTVNVEGRVFEYLHYRSQKQLIWFIMDPVHEAFNLITNFLSNIFPFDHYSKLTVNGLPTKDIDKYVDGLVVNRLIVREPKIKAENLDLILNGIDLREEIVFLAGIDETDSELTSTKIWDLAVFIAKENTLCLTSAQFLRLNCNHIKLSKNVLSAADVITWIRKWLESTDNKLQSLMVRLDKGGGNWNPEEVISQFETLEFDARYRDQYYKWKGKGLHKVGSNEYIKQHDCQNGRDILRKDGLLTTIIVTERAFNMFVWHHRFGDDFN